MSHRILILYFVLAATLIAIPVKAQDNNGGELSENQRIDLYIKVSDFLDEAEGLSNSISGAQRNQIGTLHRLADALSIRWEAFYNAQMDLLGSDDSLMAIVADYEQNIQAVHDSIAARENVLQKISDFVQAEKAILKHTPEYKQMQNRAEVLALLPQTASMLEKLKAREQLIFTELMKNYETAKEASTYSARLAKRMKALEDVVVEVKSMSTRIQAAAYKSPMERMKDYLMNMAAVSIILMFFSFAASKLQAVKKARKAAAEMKKLIQQNDDIPTI